MARGRRSEPMPVKYWSFAGLMLTYWCNARCASCYLCCGPDRTDDMSIDRALAIWRGLIRACPHGCRIHLSGGEPFGDWPRLLELCCAARSRGLEPLEKVETNAFWATDEALVEERIGALDDAGMITLSISTDPYHQQYVPIERVRLAARVAERILGPQRLQVRWRDWLAEGFDTAALQPAERLDLFVRYAAGGRDRLNGRAAEILAPRLPAWPPESFADKPCNEALLRSRHVHVDPQGLIMPGICAGIVLGTTGPDEDSVAEIWRRLDDDHDARPILSVLVRAGPFGLLDEARQSGFVPKRAYAGKCHLCWDIRKHFVWRGLHADILGPQWLYADAAK